MKTTVKYQFTNSQYKRDFNLSALLSLTGFLFLSISSPQVFAQSTEEEALKAVIRTATEVYFACDAPQWQSFRLQDEKATRTSIRNGFYDARVGWENFGPEMIRYLN